MPRRDDLESILLIGAGPIVIGQACEFDYSGTQACKVLRDEGYRVVLVNSNPATIMTDPGMAHRTYVEPLDPDSLAGIAEMTHVNLNDGVCEGMRLTDANAWSVQHHPEAGPGPHDARHLFEDFKQKMEQQ